ncbi:M35 family metallo-endopeptidase [Aliifodinibius sp. S!AR15-10]|uniref:M35 family metallo-endopeptidase n=1 Tax=Aliifodinibius sp. S!AR15-10 TaxID=2950437 RepID=UPI00286537AE|nr:M35 family metallo-endopeptidase [Aliifodinibius sp. S!AR15-10]MDR8390602.1 M35 family metallo-endopeptidase [Aliifodinibius sp. S!AR15-10]
MSRFLTSDTAESSPSRAQEFGQPEAGRENLLQNQNIANGEAQLYRPVINPRLHAGPAEALQMQPIQEEEGLQMQSLEEGEEMQMQPLDGEDTLQMKCKECEEEERRMKERGAPQLQMKQGVGGISEQVQTPQIQRQTGSAPTPTNQFEDCSTAQEQQIQNAFNDSLGHVNRATAALANAYTTHPTLSSTVSSGLSTHFHTTDKDDIMKIYRRFRDIQTAMQRGINFECETDCEPDVGGYVWQFLFWKVGDVHICFNLFTSLSTHMRKAIIIHEIAHRHAGVDDKAYQWQPEYSSLSAKDAMNNADSYAHFALLF